MSQWYAIRSATRREWSALAGLKEQKFTVFMPCETYWRQTKWTKGKDERPIYPGYMFVLCEPEDFHQILDIEAVHQFVRYMVGDAMIPMPIPLDEVIQIQAEERAGKFDATRFTKVRYTPKKGERVKITGGTWSGFFATVLATPVKGRAKLLAEGRFGAKVTLDVAHLDAA